MSIVLNDLRKNVIEALKKSNEALTLRELSEITGKSVKSGSINSLVQAGVLKVAGTKKVPVVTYREVNTYEIDDLSVLDQPEKKPEK